MPTSYTPRTLGFALVFALIAGCASGTGEGAPIGPPSPPSPPSPLLDPGAPLMNEPAPGPFKVLFETTAGDFVVQVEPEWAPQGATRFYNLVRHGYYDGTHFFRVLPGFMAQVGLHPDPAVSAAWREARIEDDPVVESNRRGTVSFAMAGPNTRTVQIFFSTGDNARLDAMGFAPFGEITGGLDVIERLYGGYGEGAPRGPGPDQSRIAREGGTYLDETFPLLDRILSARILP